MPRDLQRAERMNEELLMMPDDEHNRRLLAEVHPPAWSNPYPAERYHLAVVGGGTAGLVTAAIGAALGASVALIEREWMGGDCLNVGCVPSKALIEAARVWQTARQASSRMSGPRVAGDGDFGGVMERMRRIRAEISHHDSAARFQELGVDVFLGEGRFIGDGRLAVGDREIRYGKAVIATGTRAAVPPISGLEEAGFLTHRSVFELTELPRRLAVIGGGAIGCELGQAFRRFGSQVTIIEASERILPRDDEAAAELVAAALRREGVRILTDSTVDLAARNGDARKLWLGTPTGATEIEVDHILVATGRIPNLEALGLDRLQIQSDPRRGITVDERLRTTDRDVYAIGDVASAERFTHVADAQARLVVRNALFFGRGKSTDLVIPWCTYTTPELAQVGLTQVEAARADCRTIRIGFDEVDRARLAGETEGFLKVHLKGESDEIAGATVVGEGAGEIISLLTHAMVTGQGLATFSDTIFPYPTRAEIVRKAADAFNRGRLTPLARRAMGAFFKVR